MKTYFQLILLLPCILFLCLQSNNAVAESNIWDVEQSIGENYSDLENQDTDWVICKYVIPSHSKSPEELPRFADNSAVKALTTYSFIRAPPLFNI